ncbi:MAG: hypothetical protein AB7E30_07390, partial [Lawsonibacter sp.]
MSQKLNIESRLKAYIQKQKKRKKKLLILSVLSLFVAVSTFHLLTIPAVTLTEDPNTMESYAESASSEAETGAPGMDATPGTETESTFDAAADADAASG